jgi:Glutamine amidotransferases class-II
MCRLLAFASAGERSLEEAVGAGTLSAFRSLACVHGDGWGAAWTSADDPGGVAAHRSTTSAADDPAFAAAGQRIRGRAGFLHLRWATAGIPVDPANTHPFVADGWAFAHNGFVRGSDRIPALLPARHRAALRGTTDSERYFRLVLHLAERTGDVVTGLQEAAALIAGIGGPVSINAVLLSPSRLLAVQGLTGARAPVDDLLAMVEHPDHLPQDHLDGYFHLAFRRTGDTLVVASSGLPRDGWTPLSPDSVLDVDLATGAEARHPLLPGGTAPEPEESLAVPAPEPA